MPAPTWARSTIGEEQLEGLRRLARGSGWSILLTVGLLHYEPNRAADEVAAAERILGASLAGIEIGNEPDSYVRHHVRPSTWGVAGYAAEVDAYRSAIRRAVGPVPIAGPDVSGSGAIKSWGTEEAVRERPAVLTGHHYPLGCKLAQPPTIERLLSATTRAREWRSLKEYVRVARSHHEPFRMDESNSVSCGGTPGISDTFASALWASGYIGQALSAGAVGLNLEGNTQQLRADTRRSAPMGWGPPGQAICAPSRSGTRCCSRAGWRETSPLPSGSPATVPPSSPCRPFAPPEGRPGCCSRMTRPSAHPP